MEKDKAIMISSCEDGEKIREKRRETHAALRLRKNYRIITVESDEAQGKNLL